MLAEIFCTLQPLEKLLVDCKASRQGVGEIVNAFKGVGKNTQLQGVPKFDTEASLSAHAREAMFV